MLASDGFDVSGDEQINHDVPWLVDGDLTSQDHDFSCQHPEHCGDGLWHSVVAWDDHVNEIDWGISVAQGNGGDVDV